MPPTGASVTRSACLTDCHYVHRGERPSEQARNQSERHRLDGPDRAQEWPYIDWVELTEMRPACAPRSKPDSSSSPTVPLVLFATLREQMDAALGSQRAITTLSDFFGGLALFLSAIGL